MHGAHNICWNACILSAKKCTCTRACAPMQHCRSFFAMKAIANLSWVLLLSFNMSFLFRKIEDVTTISTSQSLTSKSIKDCTLRVPNKTTTLILVWAIIKAIFIHEHCAGYRLPPALPAVSTKSVARRCSLMKSVQIYASSWCAVAAAVSHKHHSIIRVGAGLIQFVYVEHSRLAAGLTSSKILFLPSFRASFVLIK